MEICLREEYLRAFNNEYRRAISGVAEIAKVYGVQVFLIGGVVRDIILNHPIKDIDIAVEGNAIEFADFLVKRIHGEIVNIQEDLKTAKVKFPSGTQIDFASTREEKYLESGTLPVAYNFGCPLSEDIKRRDFTINTLAIRLSENGRYTLVDYCGGYDDLKNRLIKVLHSKSFIDDPSRIIRALKFQKRLNFEFDKNTYYLMQEYLENVNKSMPLFRIKSELKDYFSLNCPDLYEYLLQKNAHKLICDEPVTAIDISRYNVLSEYNLCGQDDIWFIYFTGLILNSDVNSESLSLNSIEKKIIEEVKNLLSCDINSKDDYEIYSKYCGINNLSLAIYYIFSEDETVIRYLKKLRDIKVLITGDDLIEIGLTPSPMFKEIMTSILKEKIKGNLASKEDEIDFVKGLLKIKEGI